MFKRKAKYIDYLAEDETYQDPVEARFEAMMTLVKDLSQKDYRRLKKAMDSGYDAYNTVRNIEAYDDTEKSEGALLEEQK
jgi:hypothetical protein